MLTGQLFQKKKVNVFQLFVCPMQLHYTFQSVYLVLVYRKKITNQEPISYPMKDPMQKDTLLLASKVLHFIQ